MHKKYEDGKQTKSKAIPGTPYQWKYSMIWLVFWAIFVFIGVDHLRHEYYNDRLRGQDPFDEVQPLNRSEIKIIIVMESLYMIFEVCSILYAIMVFTETVFYPKVTRCTGMYIVRTILAFFILGFMTPHMLIDVKYSPLKDLL